jgi:Mn2+/Fe2+ NRAMP family transporter
MQNYSTLRSIHFSKTTQQPQEFFNKIGLVLPLIAFALLIALNDRGRLGNHANGPIGNAVGLTIVALCGMLALRALLG